MGTSTVAQSRLPFRPEAWLQALKIVQILCCNSLHVSTATHSIVGSVSTCSKFPLTALSWLAPSVHLTLTAQLVTMQTMRGILSIRPIHSSISSVQIPPRPLIWSQIIPCLENAIITTTACSEPKIKPGSCISE